mmetsp:Transcript_29279/g.76727  ORF Transcript_29279/g.76727 Transcript_29279/m.76727 type:complete len:277 (-) Transcript_29279:1550-2380(-)
MKASAFPVRTETAVFLIKDSGSGSASTSVALAPAATVPASGYTESLPSLLAASATTTGAKAAALSSAGPGAPSFLAGTPSLSATSGFGTVIPRRAKTDGGSLAARVAVISAFGSGASSALDSSAASAGGATGNFATFLIPSLALISDMNAMPPIGIPPIGMPPTPAACPERCGDASPSSVPSSNSPVSEGGRTCLASLANLSSALLGLPLPPPPPPPSPPSMALSSEAMPILRRRVSLEPPGDITGGLRRITGMSVYDRFRSAVGITSLATPLVAS